MVIPAMKHALNLLRKRPLSQYFWVLLLCTILLSCNSDSGGSGGSGGNGGVISDPDPLLPYQWYLLSDGGNKAAAFSATSGGSNHANVLNVHTKLKITGDGITVNVIDSGLELNHPDLRTNPAQSYDYLEDDTDPQPLGSKGDHGTSVAGIIGMKDNSIGGVGVAPGVTLIGHAFVQRENNQGVTAASGLTSNEYAQSMGLSELDDNKATEIAQVYNQSFGSAPDSLSTSADNDIYQTIYEYGVSDGRSGKGYIYVKSAGNGFVYYKKIGSTTYEFECNDGSTSCDNASEDFSNTLPENIVVSATNAAGVLSSYSTTGSAVWVAAPGGEVGFGDLGVKRSDGYTVWKELLIALGHPEYYLQPAMVTTDVTDCSRGYSQKFTISNPTSSSDDPMRNLFEYDRTGPHSLNPNCNFTSIFSGTSSAAPVVSGVVALMLEANPSLGWRDVKHILATTATKIDADKGNIKNKNNGIIIDHGWTQNTAGYWFSNWYGFGQVNAYEAVKAAINYSTYLSDYTTDISANTTLPQSIPENSDGASVSLDLDKDLIIESVRVVVTIEGGHPDDLSLQLKSPKATLSTLFANGLDYDTSSEDGTTYSMNEATFLSNAFYGELSSGEWQLRVYDHASNTFQGELTSWSIIVNGHPQP